MKTYLFILTLFVTLTINAATYYVAKNGNDSNVGTEAQPWLTIQKAADTLIAGDTVYIKSGTYKEIVIAKQSGDVNNYITYAAFENDLVVVDGEYIYPGDHYWSGVIDLGGRSYIIVKGITVVGSTAAGIYGKACENIYVENCFASNTWSSGIQFWDSTNIFVISNDVQYACMGNNGTGAGDGLQECITISGVDNFVVSYNHVHNRPIDIDTEGGEGIDAKENCSNGRIHHNIVHGINSEVGIYVDGWKSYEHDLDVFNNIVYETKLGIIVAVERNTGSLKNINIYNNILYNNKYSGIEVSDNDDDAPKENIFIFNNTCYSNGFHDGIEWGGGIYISSKNVKNVVVRNNICSQNAPWQIAAKSVSMSEITAQNNLIYNFKGYDDSGLVEIKGDNSVETNPEFGNTLSYDFHIMPNSPAIDAGTNEGLLATDTDFDGNSRIIGAKADIGAFEYVSTYTTLPAIPTTISASDGVEINVVNVAWAPADRATFYQVFRNNTNDLLSAINISGNVGFGTYKDDTVGAVEIYFYWVRSGNNVGTSDFSNSNSGFAMNGIIVSAEAWKLNKKKTKLVGKTISPLLSQYFNNNYGIGIVGTEGIYKPVTKNNKVWKYISNDKSIKIIYREKNKKGNYKTKLIYKNKNDSFSDSYQIYVVPTN